MVVIIKKSLKFEWVPNIQYDKVHEEAEAEATIEENTGDQPPQLQLFPVEDEIIVQYERERVNDAELDGERESEDEDTEIFGDFW